ncbi:DUF2690 domain-containing protein [Kribbella sp. CA-245084]|uniref:DUF2690 domain-containing protein n=1 Tax=Kribbella sp. CA-245084 TaxID=3239940 RepID=UPI003D909EB8
MPAQAASCTYAACGGLDPETIGCSNDAVTKPDLLATYSLYLVELRWSPSFHAFWTRIHPKESGGGNGTYAYIAGGVYDANGTPVTRIVYTSNPAGSSWTKTTSQAYPWERFCAFATGYGSGCKMTTSKLSDRSLCP